MNEQTGLNRQQIVIEEYYTKEGEDIFRIWRYEGGEWRKQLTPLCEFPFIELKRSWEPEKVDWKHIGEDT